MVLNIRRTPEQLQAAIAVVRYHGELVMASGLALGEHLELSVKALTPHELLERPGEFLDAIKCALVTAFLIHVRALIDFYFPSRSRRADDIVAEDFLDDPSVWLRSRGDGVALRQLGARIGKLRAHSTYKWSEVADDWEVRSVYEEIGRLHDLFNSLGPSHRLEENVRAPKSPYRPDSTASRD